MIKKHAILALVEELLNDSRERQTELAIKAINSGALDIDNWNPKCDHMIIPKIIAITVLEDEANSIRPNGTSHEKYVNKEIYNLKLFI